MQVNLEKTEGLGRKLNVKVPEKEITKQYQSRIQSLAKEARIKGFRPGKVPTREIERRYGQGVRQEIIGQVVQKSLYDSIDKEKLRLAGAPNITELKADPGQDLEFTASFEILPEMKLLDLSGVEIEKTTSIVDDNAVEKTIENLRKQRTVWDAVERAAKEDDQLIIDFEAFKGDEAVKNSQAKDQKLVLGSETMPKEFEKALVGKKAGDKFEIDVTYPKEYNNPDIAGQTVKFKGKVYKVSEPHLPELNEEFVKVLGVEGGMEGLNQEVKKALEREVDQILKNINKQKVVEKILDINKDIELPETLLKSEYEALHQQMGHHHQNGEDCGSKAELEEQAKKRVALGLIIGEFANKYELKADPQRVREVVESMAIRYPQPQQMLNWYYEDKRRLAPIEWTVLEDLVAEKLLASATIKEKSISYDELTQQ